MSHPRLLPLTLFLFALPLLVAALQLPFASAAALVLIALAWRWAIALSLITAPDRHPELVLRTISASHFAEKVRWCMDRLGLEYTERKAGGTLGAFFTGRTVPQLWFRTGNVRSTIGNSPEILRYLWGRYAVSHGTDANFLAPTAERLDLEKRTDRCGVNLQVWVYYHFLPHRALTLHAWGAGDPAVPAWHRLLLRVLYPLLALLIRRAFRISDAHYAKAVSHIEANLEDAEARLADGRPSLIAGEQPNFADLAFAAIHALWLQPGGYGGGAADAVRIDRSRMPERMRADVDSWARSHPLTVAFIERLYASRRLQPAG